MFFKKKRWYDFKEAQQIAYQRSHLFWLQWNLLESVRNLWKNNTDLFGMIKR